jgi:hypothetical protein
MRSRALSIPLHGYRATSKRRNHLTEKPSLK